MGWWFDQKSCQQTLKIKRIFEVEDFVETGAYRGLNLRFWSHYFRSVYGCENNDKNFNIADKNTEHYQNIFLCYMNSPYFLQTYLAKYNEDKRNDYVIFYLDAHFYNPELKNKFVITEELDVLAGFDKAIIIIHDFDCSGLGHIEYDDIKLNMELVKEKLHKVNKNFLYFVNTKETCDPVDMNSAKYIHGVTMDSDTIETINYHNTDRLRYRGMLYCIPKIFDLELYHAS